MKLPANNNIVKEKEWLKILTLLLRLGKIALTLSIIILLGTIVLVLLFGPVTNERYGVIFTNIAWYLLMFSFWTLLLSLPLLILATVYRKATGQLAWSFVRLETILFLAASALSILLYAVSQLRN